ncbi:class I SAM-dependent methyltransferase [Nitrobacter sp. JJSN]|uniref:class I SAM-dependent methyltransferase n=1 Tax=Nitrobacter sp. JJSN TaxID=3453033 RepID=UPI003F760FDA
MINELENRQQHWDTVYSTKSETSVSWFQENPEPSLGLIVQYGGPKASVIDVGGGASNLVDSLLARGFEDVTVLDLSVVAIDITNKRLGKLGERVEWLVADATTWTPARTYHVWHDRAAFHFLVTETDRRAYVDRLKRALVVGGHVIIATFAPDGPENCSGLLVQRHNADSLGQTLGPSFVHRETRKHSHGTPWGSVQAFQFNIFRRDS